MWWSRVLCNGIMPVPARAGTTAAMLCTPYITYVATALPLTVSRTYPALVVLNGLERNSAKDANKMGWGSMPQPQSICAWRRFCVWLVWILWFCRTGILYAAVWLLLWHAHGAKILAGQVCSTRPGTASITLQCVRAFQRHNAMACDAGNVLSLV